MQKWLIFIYIGLSVVLGTRPKSMPQREVANTVEKPITRITFTLYKYPSLPAKVVVLDKPSAFYKVKLNLASSERLLCFYNDKSFTLERNQTWELLPHEQVKIACQINPENSKTLKTQLHAQYEMFLVENVNSNFEVEKWKELKAKLLKNLSTTDKSKLSQKLIDETFFLDEKFQNFYKSTTVNIETKSALKEVQLIEKGDVIHFYNPTAETYNSSVKPSDDVWGFNYQGDDENPELKTTFLEPQLINAVMVCGISHSTPTLPLIEKIFVGSKQDFSLSTNHSGKLGCRINGEKNLLTKRSGSGRIYLEVIKKSLWLDFIEQKIKELEQAQKLAVQTRLDEDIKQHKKFTSEIQKLAAINKKMIAMEPVVFCEKKISARTLEYKTSMASALLYGTETRAPIGRSCGDPVFDQEQNAFFVCTQCATPVTDTQCPGDSKDAFLIKLNGQEINEQLKFQSERFELKDVGHKADFYPPLLIENTIYLTGNKSHLYFMDLDGRIIQHHDFGEFHDAGGFIQVEDFALVLIEQGKIDQPAFGAFFDHQGKIVSKFLLNVKVPTQPIYVENKIIYADFFGSRIFVLDNKGNQLKIIDLQKLSRREEIEIKSLSYLQNKLYAGDDKGQLFEIRLDNYQARLFFTVPPLSENISLAINFSIKQLSTNEILLISNNRAYIITPTGKLSRIFAREHHTISGTPSLIQYQNEELIWLVRTSEIALYDLEGRKLMSYETSYNENTQGLFNFILANGFLSPMRDGMRFFKFIKTKELENETSYFIPCPK